MADKPKLQDGYAYAAQYNTDNAWAEPDIDMIVPSEAALATHVGFRVIDGAHCAVFRLHDGSFAAQVSAMTRRDEP